LAAASASSQHFWRVPSSQSNYSPAPVNAILVAPLQVRLDKGKNVLTIHILTLGNLTLAYFDFKPVYR